MAKVSFTGWVPADWPDERVIRFAEDGKYPEQPDVFLPYCDKYHIEVVAYPKKEVAIYAATHQGARDGAIRKVHIDIKVSLGTGRVRVLRTKPSKVVIVGWVPKGRKDINHTAWDIHHVEIGVSMKKKAEYFLPRKHPAEKIRVEVTLTDV